MDGVLKIIDNTIGKEGGFSNHPSDRGGPTRWGITEAVAQANGYHGDMRQLPREMAVQIYLQRYYNGPNINLIGAVNERIAEELFDTAVNMGPAWAGIFIQQSLNALNAQGKHYADIKEDGDIGGQTVGALKAYLSRRGSEGVEVMLKALNILQGKRYFEILSRKANEDFMYGWIRTRIEL